MAQFRKDTHQYLSDGKTIFEVVMLADQYGNLVGPSNPTGMSIDAFGRSRQSQPLTLFDSFYRFGDNDKFATSNTATGTYSYVANTASVDLTVNTTSGAKVLRESKKVFAYQPGKSLQILTTFVMNPAKANLRQRVGYFGEDNGFFLERTGASTVQFVKRSKVTGSVVDTPVTQANWNIDKLDGTGPSLLTLNLDNPQILFIDVEWLGVGSVRMGFVINGQLIWCHSFHHANENTSPKGAYMQTACLPIRYEIENTSTTATESILKQICSTVISEGGYELRGKSRTVGMNPSASKTLTTPGTYYPLVSIRLHPDRPDAIVVPAQVDILPITTDNYRWKLVTGGTWSGDTWANVASDSVVQYQTNATATISGYTEINSGYATSTVQGGGFASVTDGDMFKYQLERDRFANTTTPFTLIITSQKATSNAAGSLAWFEIT